jgi:predicted DNA-binding transcriptional regulator AlpA
MTPQDSERLLSRVEVEERFGITKRYLEELATRGGGPKIVKLGGRAVRYRPQDIREWIEARLVEHTSADIPAAADRPKGGRHGRR